MRLLLFTNSAASIARHGKSIGGYNGGGWIFSLYTRLLERKELTLAMAGLDSDTYKVDTEHIIFYLTGYKRKALSEKVFSGLNPSDMSYERQRWAYYKDEFQKVVDDFRPDVIHVFGTEYYFGLVAQGTDIPVVVHLQGILNPLLDAYFPPGVSLLSYCLQDIHPKRVWSRFQIYKEWQRDCVREREVFGCVKHFIGRTEWDKVCTKIFAPDSEYHYGSEILRPCFYERAERSLPQKLTIVTTISFWTYKGFDLVLKTASVLKRLMKMDFCWKVYGGVNPAFWEKLTGIKHDEVGVELCGVASAEQLRQELMNCTCYVHPSYIDNSPNSVCEAQICGCPVVVTNVGGESSLVEEGKTGFLVPANDPYMAAWRIRTLFEDEQLNRRMGGNAKEVARQRHDVDAIVCGLIDIYKKLVMQ